MKVGICYIAIEIVAEMQNTSDTINAPRVQATENIYARRVGPRQSRKVNARYGHTFGTRDMCAYSVIG